MSNPHDALIDAEGRRIFDKAMAALVADGMSHEEIRIFAMNVAGGVFEPIHNTGKINLSTTLATLFEFYRDALEDHVGLRAQKEGQA